MINLNDWSHINEILSSQYHRHKVKIEISKLSSIEKTNLVIGYYKSGMALTRIYSAFNCKPTHVADILIYLDIKRCSKCGSILSRNNFNRQASGSFDGLSSFCRPCQLQYNKSEPIQLREKSRRKIRNKMDDILEHRAEYQRQRRHSDPIYRLRMNFSSLMSRRLKNKSNISKNCSCFNILDYSFDELVCRLEGLFSPGMSWDNYGKWHVDHIRPISSFNITSLDCDDFKECWSLTNLQPLWAEDNMRKSNKV